VDLKKSKDESLAKYKEAMDKARLRGCRRLGYRLADFGI